MRLDNQRFGALFVILLSSFLLVANCHAQPITPDGTSNIVKGNPKDVLAEIKDSKITREIYDRELEMFKRVAAPQAVARMITPEGKQDFLRQLVEVTMFQKKAELEGLDKTYEYKKELQATSEAVISVERLKKVMGNVNVSDAEAKKFYDENIKRFVEPDQYHLFWITTDTKQKADEVLSKLKAGKSFIEMAKAFSIDTSKENGGDRGFVTLENEAPEVAAAVANLAKDGLSDSIALADDLYVIVKYTEKKVGSAKAFETVSTQIKRDIATSKQVEAFKAEIDRLKKAYNFTTDQKALGLLKKESLTEADLNATLAKYDGGEVKIADVYRDLEQIPAFIRPQIIGGEGFRDFLEQHFARVLSMADVKKNFASYSKENPDVVSDVARRTKVKALFDKVLNPVTVSEEEIKDFYSKNLASFKAPAQISAHHILVKDEETAKKLLADLVKEPGKFEAVAKASSTCPSGRSGGDLGAFGEGQMVPEFEAACKTAEIGKVVGPVKTSFGYHLIRVDNRTVARTMKLEEVSKSINDQLLPQRQKETFDAYVEALRKEFNVRVYPGNL